MNENWKKVTEIDLRSVKEKLKSKKGMIWKMRNNVDSLEKEYRQFLYLIMTNPGKTVVPWTQEVDDFWHEHILDTAKYEKDCQKLFGKMLHHNPHLPVGTAEQKTAFADTKKMYKEAFADKAKEKKKGSSSSDSSAGCTAFMPVFCGGGCSSGHSSSSVASCSSSSSSSSASCSSGSSCSGGSSCGGGGGGCGGGGD